MADLDLGIVMENPSPYAKYTLKIMRLCKKQLSIDQVLHPFHIKIFKNSNDFCHRTVWALLMLGHKGISNPKSGLVPKYLLKTYDFQGHHWLLKT